MEYAVKLNLYRGKKNFDEDKKLTSEMIAMDLSPYNGLEWNNFMKHASIVGYTSAEVTAVNSIKYTKHPKPEGKEGETITLTTYPSIDMDEDIVNEIKENVKSAFDTTPKVVLTPEQKEIAELKATVKNLVDNKKPKEETKKSVKINKTPNTDEELEDARDKYLKVFEKKPNHLMKLENINKAIEAELNK